MSLYVSLFVGLHDSNISFATDDQVLLHIEAERVLQRKHALVTWEEMEQLVHVGLNAIGRRICDINTLYVGRWGCRSVNRITLLGRKFCPIWTDHHANHVGLAKYLGWEDAIAVCADGGSENGCSAVYFFDGDKYSPVEDLDSTILTGRFYGTLTQLVIGSDFEKAHIHWPGKTMGLSGFGTYDDEIAQLIKEDVAVFNRLNLRGINELEKRYGLQAESGNRCHHRWNIGRTGQQLWEDIWISKLAEYAHLSSRLIFSGGCALNVLLNHRIRKSSLFSDIFVPPTASDCGQALGAILHRHYPKCKFPFLGFSYGEMTKVPDRAVDDLAAGRIVLWFNGRSEIGPRALGHRSILGLPDSIDRRIRLSQEVKGREWYRPVAAVIREEIAADWFEVNVPSPFMLEALPVKEKTRKIAPAIVHVDGTCRLQTVSADQDPILWGLLEKVHQETGCPMLMNTSMNVREKPICDSPEDALRLFNSCGADILYLNDETIEK
ncbi:MAG: carbamoyl transferase NodU family protein [Deltaproteobacteria bacterium]|nr:carbamoyl transferase NodU family protein [Deltaproteobacteria bacterium]